MRQDAALQVVVQFAFHIGGQAFRIGIGVKGAEIRRQRMIAFHYKRKLECYATKPASGGDHDGRPAGSNNNSRGDRP
jgi:hypothetical protein